MKQRVADAKRRMEGASKAFANEMNSVRSGRASTALLDRVTVDAYGVRTPLNQLASISAPEARLLTIQPYDRGLFQSIEKAIQESDLGLTPNNDGQIIRIGIHSCRRNAARNSSGSSARWPKMPELRCATSAEMCSTRSSALRRPQT